MKNKILSVIIVIFILFLFPSCWKGDLSDVTTTRRLSQMMEYENGNAERKYTFIYKDGLLTRIDEYGTDNAGEWVYKIKREFSYKENFEVGIVSRSIEYPSYYFYHRRSYLDGKLVETYSPEKPYPFVPAFTSIYQWDGDLLMQITGFMQMDTISKTTRFYEDNNLIEHQHKVYKLYPLTYWKSEYTYEESLIKESIVYDYVDTINTWAPRQKAVNEYQNSKLVKTTYYDWKDDTYELSREEYFYYDRWGYLGLWTQYDLLSGDDFMIEYLFESGTGNHSELFIRREPELWKEWYPYPVYY